MAASHNRRLPTLSTRVALVALVLSLAAIWLLTYATVTHLHGSMATVLANQQFSAVSLLAEEIDQKVRLRFKVLQNLASGMTPALGADPAGLQAHLDEQPLLRELFSIGIVAISADGRYLAAAPESPTRRQLDFTQFEYFQTVMAQSRPAVGKPRIGPVSGKPSIAFAVPVAGPGDRTVAVLAGFTTLSDPTMFASLEHSAVGKTGWIAISDPVHRLIVSASDSSRILTPVAQPGQNAMFDRFMAGFEGSGIAINSRGIETLTSARRVPSTGWILQGVLPTAEAFAPIRQLQEHAYLLAAAVSAVISFLIWASLRQLLRPLAATSRRIRRMARGEESIGELPAGAGDEIGELVNSFNQLLRQRSKDEAELLLAANVFARTADGIVVTDTASNILSVNPAFSEITGYEAAEAIGRKPKLWRSEHHTADFYREMWSVLLETGRWRGEIWNRRKNGEAFLTWLSITAVPGPDGQAARYVSVFNDITELRRKDDRIQHLAFHDSLTGLANRALFLDRLEQGIGLAHREGGRLAVMFIDLDRFKQINDSLGHDIGDELLKHSATRLAACLRETDTVARIGGDEFVVMLRNGGGSGDLATLAEKIIAALGRPLRLGERDIQIGASVGIACYPFDGDDVVALMKHADAAMYAAKSAGRGTYRFFQPALTEKAVQRLTLEMELRTAIERNELELHYQPKVRLGDDRPCGLEALVRWRHPSHGLVPPGEFIPVAEESGIIDRLGDWVLAEACRQIAAWQAAGAAVLPVAVNISARQLQTGNLEDRLGELCASHGIEPRLLEMELTESSVMANPEYAAGLCRRLRERGVRIAMDDFGTGYSSLAYLLRLPIDTLKIDRSFVMNVDRGGSEAQIVRTILALAASLSLEIVAEGIETREQAAFLRACGCPLGQGYFYSRPLPAAAIAAWLQDRLPEHGAGQLAESGVEGT